MKLDETFEISGVKQYDNHEGRSSDCHGKGIEFAIKVHMGKRWVPHFLSMLKYMESLGGMGSSREVSFYADGDGDFRPKFEFDESLPSDVKPTRDHNGDRFYDAG